MMDKIKLGIDRIDEYSFLFKNKRVGLVTNPTGVNGQFKSTIDCMQEKMNLVALYSPEHGVRGNIQAGEKIEEYIDQKTGLKVYTLYGKNKKPTYEILKDIDILAFDIQDVGSRLYTYIYTMAYCMQSAKQFNKQIIIFDRPNPMGGEKVEGNIVQEGFESFIGLYPITYRHGLTYGELANMFNDEFGIGCKLTVIPMDGWKREMVYEDTGLQWIPPSPNMPTVDTVFIYNGTCIFEGTNISEGRGTAKPFEWIGAPWLDGDKLAEIMNAKKLEGVYFRPIYFTPTFSKHKNNLCEGVQIHILKRDKINIVSVGLHLLQEVKKQSGDKFEYLPPYTSTTKHMIDYNTGSDYVRKNSFNPETLAVEWEKEASVFKNLKTKYHLYK